MRKLPGLAPIAAVIVVLTTANGPSIPPVAADDACAVSHDYAALDAEEQAAVDGINTVRSQAGQVPLAVSSALMRPARWKSSFMASGASFAHDDPFRPWTQRLTDCGYGITAWVSENLAAGEASGTDVLRMWMDSPPHRANLLNPDIRFIGIARAAGGAYGWYWSADFGVAPGDNVAANVPPGQ